MSLGFQWSKHRLLPGAHALMDRAVRELNQDSGADYHVIKQPFGKVVACRVGDLWLFHVGDGGRPPLILTLAVTTDPEQRLLMPTRSTSDFDRCCDLLKLEGEEHRAQFRDFLFPNLDQTFTSNAQKAF